VRFLKVSSFQKTIICLPIFCDISSLSDGKQYCKSSKSEELPLSVPVYDGAGIGQLYTQKHRGRLFSQQAESGRIAAYRFTIAGSVNMKEELLGSSKQHGISRRDFIGTTAATLCLASGVSAVSTAAKQQTLKPDLSASVQMQFLRPGQLEKALRDFPAVYVPFGLIEWHGRHLPLGNDALKAHAILVKVAEQFGGVVYPPVYFHDGFPQESLVPVLTALFQRLKKIGAIRILRDIFDKMMFPLESSVASSNS
jgi:hypothetical protein